MSRVRGALLTYGLRASRPPHDGTAHVRRRDEAMTVRGFARVHKHAVHLLTAERILIVAGVLLLAVSALTGFMQAREVSGTPGHTLWRVAHAGGTAGAVQLIALGAAIDRLFSSMPDALVFAVLVGISAGTWLFFVGPLLRALGAERLANRVNLVGACIAGPAYLALPLLMLR